VRTTKLKGKPYTIVKYGKITTWEIIKKLLVGAFETLYEAENLQIKLSFIKTRKDETVNEYNFRVVEIFQK